MQHLFAYCLQRKAYRYKNNKFLGAEKKNAPESTGALRYLSFSE